MAALNAGRLRAEGSNWWSHKYIKLKTINSKILQRRISSMLGPDKCSITVSQRRLNLTEHYQHYLLNLSNSIQWSGVCHIWFMFVETYGNQRTLNVKHRLQVWFEMMERNSTFQGSNDYTILNMFHKEAWCIAGTYSGHNTHFYFFTSCSSTKINLCRWTVMTTQDYSDKDVIQDHD